MAHDRQLDTDGRAGRFLTGKSCAIAGFAFAVFSMLGQGTWSLAFQALFWNSSYPQSDVLNVMAVWGLGSLSIAVVGIILARRTLRAVGAVGPDRVGDGADTWEAHLARAAVLVSGAGVLLSLLGIVAATARGL